MSDDALQARLEAIDRKLDSITAFIAAEERRRLDNRELREDLSLVARDVFSAAVVELDQVKEHFTTEDLLHLLKKLLRNTRNINRMLDQMSGVADFFEDFRPLGKQMFQELMDTLDQMDRKGYFVFMKEAGAIADTIVTSFKPDDVRLLRENIVAILNTVRSMTQPDVLATVNNAASFFRKMDIAVERDVSLRNLVSQMRDPDVRRGIYFLLQFAKGMAARPQPLQPITSPNHS